MNCPTEHASDQDFQQLLDESLSRVDQLRVEAHLESCSECQGRLSEAASESPWWHGAKTYLDSEISSDLAKSRNDSTDLREVQAVISPSDDPRMLGRIGTYEVAGLVGSGAAGIVLKALDPSLNRYVAIKLLRPSLAGTSASRIRFEREGRSAASVIHENVIAIHGVAETRGVPYLVMPYIRGESLGARIARRGPLSFEKILRIGHQIAGGLAAAHAQGIVHRDIKPSNILLDEGVERLKLTDFGLAQVVGDTSLTATGVLAGTPEFMSPEQAKGQAIDARSDLFSLGSVLWTMSTGHTPFVADTCYAVIRRIVESEPTSLRMHDSRLPPWWQDFVAKLMSKDPQKRFQSAAEVADLLRGCLAHVQDASNPLPKPIGNSDSGFRLGRRTILFGVASALGLSGLIAAYPWTDFAESSSAPLTGPQQIHPQDIDAHAATNPTPLPLNWEDGTEERLSGVQGLLSELD